MYTYDSITRNGVTTILPNTYVDYDWKLDKYDVLKDLDTKVVIKGVERYVFQYRKNGTTIIKVKDITTGAITQETRTGFVPVTVTTEGDGVKVSY